MRTESFTYTKNDDGTYTVTVDPAKYLENYKKYYDSKLSKNEEHVLVSTKNQEVTLSYEDGAWTATPNKLTFNVEHEMKEVNYTVIYHSNNPGSEETRSSNGIIGESLTLKGNKPFTRVGHTFAGWAETENGEAKYQGAEKLATGFDVAAGAEVHLYAVWTPNKYTVSFNANGGSTVESQIVEYGKYASEPTSTRRGYRLVGWYLEDKKFDFAATPIADNIELTAKWKVNAPAIDPDGGKFTGSVKITIVPFAECIEFVAIAYAITGFVVGVFGSMLSIRKFLRV